MTQHQHRTMACIIIRWASTLVYCFGVSNVGAKLATTEILSYTMSPQHFLIIDMLLQVFPGHLMCCVVMLAFDWQRQKKNYNSKSNSSQ